MSLFLTMFIVLDAQLYKNICSGKTNTECKTSLTRPETKIILKRRTSKSQFLLLFTILGPRGRGPQNGLF